MRLPQRTSSQSLTLPDDSRQITVIGANGSGKTRFTEAMVAICQKDGLPVFRLSALEALYSGGKKNGDVPLLRGEHPALSVDEIYQTVSDSPTFLKMNDSSSSLEYLISLLLNEEIASLIEYKTSPDAGNGTLPETKIDTVLSLWRKIFPDNSVSTQGGALVFSRSGSSDPYPHLRLSDGEKTVLFYLGAVLYAPENAVVFVDSPGMFLHTSSVCRVWDMIENLRLDCRFVYTTHDLDFAATRSRGSVVWVKSYQAEGASWDYDLLPPGASGSLPEGAYMAILGARRPVLFIEGDAVHSIDARLYPLVFPEYTIRPLGSCNKVIEAVRTFNDLSSFHHMDSRGIVDRDRRDEKEVDYLRRKNIFVADVAEVENLLLLEGVVRAVASYNGKNPDKVFASVRKSVMGQFRTELRRQALLHTRHRVKMTMSYRIDGRFTSIGNLEKHLADLMTELSPRSIYEEFCRRFTAYLNRGDYASVLRVYNQKAMLPGSNVTGLCGLPQGRDSYVDAIISILRTDTPQADEIRRAISSAFFPEGVSA